MRNRVGKHVSGSDYFIREALERLIYRRLDAGSCLFMAAPRRVGKTSIMHHLKDAPKEGYAFIYLLTEEIDSSELYFKRLFEALLNSDVVSKKRKAYEKSKDIFDSIIDRIKKVGAFDIGIELREGKEENYADVFRDLMNKLEPDDLQIVIMIDEFPSTVENIRQTHGEREAVLFLKRNRSIRQQSAGGIQFIYTGSIGLPAIVNRLGTPESINDLNQVEILPLSKEDAMEFMRQLLDAAQVPYQLDALDYMLDKIKWLIPFFIQLSVQELIDLFDQNEQTIRKEKVDEAFKRICHRRNNTHFDSYHERLKDTFNEEEHQLALDILNTIASVDQIAKKDLYIQLGKEEEKRKLYSIIASLEYDGYIHLNEDNCYSFNSPILQIWWNKYI